MLIDFEGIDGSGKTTQINLLKQYLNETGEKVNITGPFLTPYGKAVRKIFMGYPKTAMLTQIFLLASSMSEVAAEVKKKRIEQFVLLDRYVYTTYAYHGGGLKVGVENVRNIYLKAIQGIEPDIVFLLDIDPKIALSRINKKRDRIERFPLEFYKRVRSVYLKLAKETNQFYVLDATEDRNIINRQIIRIINNVREINKLHTSP